VLREEHSDLAARLANSAHDLHAPDFALLEVDNVLCTYVRRGELTQVEADEARAKLARTPLRRHALLPLRDEAFDIASQTGRTCYDCLYLALAVALGGRTVTADRRFHNAIKATSFAQFVVWIGDV
jgi:predicted nucleic acid-binding protein